VQKPDRIGAIAEHPHHLLRELRRLGFRTMVQRRNGQISASGAMLKRGIFSLYVLVPSRGHGGLVVAWEGSGPQGVRIIERGWTMRTAEVVQHVNGALYQIEQLSS
jgi:hypothetical protein